MIVINKTNEYYHKVLKPKLFLILKILKTNFPRELLAYLLFDLLGLLYNHRKNCTASPKNTCVIFCDKLASKTILIFSNKKVSIT